MFIGGLLHDVGKIVLDTFFSDSYAPVLIEAMERDIPIAEAERRVLGVSHADIGAQLAAMWNLPTELIEVIERHHQPMEADDRVRQTTALVHVADILCRKLGIGNAGDQIVPQLDQGVLDILGLQPDVLDSYLPEIEEGAKKSVAFLTAI